jgi:hypothetical protein
VERFVWLIDVLSSRFGDLEMRWKLSSNLDPPPAPAKLANHGMTAVVLPEPHRQRYFMQGWLPRFKTHKARSTVQLGCSSNLGMLTFWRPRPRSQPNQSI